MRQFTKMAIMESFIRLLNEKPLDKITVKEIVDDCGINRNTFYYHFEDIHALLVYILDAEAEKVIKEHASVESLEEGFIAAAHFALENKRAVYHIYYSVSREELERYLNSIVQEVMERLAEELTRDVPKERLVGEEDLRLVLQFYKNGMVGLTTEWLSHGMKEEPEPLIRRLGELLRGSLKSALLKPEARSFGQTAPGV
ncbi:MAG: TetR family transcriptional regulator [Lachnospiraceae bacterium]|jgi:AcrR family transcriptional regulator|nr:TetR family transcriptional regulator [Lachnospiraceae bacterium]MCI9133437.1 TetR family transcriptional regulator [Lachnospiraceae bacterium]